MPNDQQSTGEPGGCSARPACSPLVWSKEDPRKSSLRWYVVRWQTNGVVSVERGDRIAWEHVAYWLEIPEPPDFQWDCRHKPEVANNGI